MKKHYEHVSIEFVGQFDKDVICASFGGGDSLTDKNGNWDGVGKNDFFA